MGETVSKYYIETLLNKYKRIRKYQVEHYKSPPHSVAKVKGKIEVLKEILKHEENKNLEENEWLLYGDY